MMAPSAPICGVTLTANASVRTIAGSLLTATSDGVATTVVLPCDASACMSLGRSTMRQAAHSVPRHAPGTWGESTLQDFGL